MKGAPLMRIFKANGQVQSEEDRARDARLNAIASRYKVRDKGDAAEEQSDRLEVRDVLQ